jgi:hypothetical protein
MNNKRKPIPFGLLFEEVAPQPSELIIPLYDEEADLAYVIDSQGHRIPFVECCELTSTDTFTKAAGEPTDKD